MRAPESDLPIELESVSLSIGSVAPVRDVTASLRAGWPTAIIGPNGAGKTTLLRLMMGLVEPSAGRITWGGRGLAAGGARRCAMVFQRPVMLRRSVAANVAYALSATGSAPRDAEVRVAAALDRVGLSALAARPARRLSGGEQQRLALARALVRCPDVLLLDEPTASLDPSATKSVEDIIAGAAASGVKIVFATHDLGQARRLAGDVLFMVGGHLREAGPAEPFFQTPRSAAARAFLRGELVIGDIDHDAST